MTVFDRSIGMAGKIPIAARERNIRLKEENIRLKGQILRLQEKIARLNAKHAKEIAKLEAQRGKLVVTPEQLEQIRQLRGAPESPGGR
jgi:hypothetical protein